MCDATFSLQILSSYREAQKLVVSVNGLKQLYAFSRAWDAAKYRAMRHTVGQLVQDTTRLK
jgi:hypothetical protein